MTNEQLEILIKAHIPEEWREYCYITAEGKIFTPRFSREDNSLIMTGEETYNLWLENKNKPVEIEPTPEEKIETLQEQVVTLEEELMVTNQYITDLELELFEIKAML